MIGSDFFAWGVGCGALQLGISHVGMAKNVSF